MNENVVRVDVYYGRKLEDVEVDGEKLDISAIQEKPVRDWFEESNGRDGWKGLIPEIFDRVLDEGAKPVFYFNGPVEEKRIFENCLRERG